MHRDQNADGDKECGVGVPCPPEQKGKIGEQCHDPGAADRCRKAGNAHIQKRRRDKQKIDLLFIQSQQAQKERAQPEQYREVCAADGENVADAETAEIAFQAVCKSVLVADQQRLQHGSGLGLVCAVDPRGDCALQPREKRRLLLADDRVCRDGAGEQDAVRDLAVPLVVAVEVGRKRRTVGDGSDHVARFEVGFALNIAVEHILQTLQRNGMRHRRKIVQHSVAHPLGGRIRRDLLRMLLFHLL